VTKAGERRVALVGTGMIGGSLVLALKAAGAIGKVVGVDPQAAERARALGIVDEVAASPSAIGAVDVVILATPVRATASVCEALAPALKDRPDVLVTDAGSTKVEVLRAVQAMLPFPERFVGAHPIAGTERSGPEAASATLFAGKRCLLTPVATTRPDKVAECAALWQSAGFRTTHLDPAEHDRALAYVSHLPHAVAFALASAVGSGHADGLSGGGFADTTRIAGSDPIMWRDIFLANRGPLLRALATLESELGELQRAVASGDGAALMALIERARAARKQVLEGGR
jgi:prephenate dehydrogenase